MVKINIAQGKALTALSKNINKVNQFAGIT